MVETLADYNCRICGQREVQLDQDDIDMLFAAHKESEAFEAIGSQMLRYDESLRSTHCPVSHKPLHDQATPVL